MNGVSFADIPLHIDPVAFSIGMFPVRFYGLFWIVAFVAAFLFLDVLSKRGGKGSLFREILLDGAFVAFVGAMVGGRIGYALLYAPAYFWHHPAALFIPVNGGSFTGFFGMSFFGGVCGAVVALWLFLRQMRAMTFGWKVFMDHYALAAPIALFFGRIGNFLNGELHGRVTTVPWGMYFPGGGSFLRHPSALYEAFLEGVVLLLLLLVVRKHAKMPGVVSACFLLGYGIFRFFAEFFREPDTGSDLLIGVFTRGQAYCVVLLFVAIGFFRSIGDGKYGILERRDNE